MVFFAGRVARLALLLQSRWIPPAKRYAVVSFSNLLADKIAFFLMHAAQLVDLAAVLALHGPALLYRRELIPDEGLQTYWLATKNRFDAWHEALARHQQVAAEGNSVTLKQWWVQGVAIIEEILLSESLTRVYAALGDALDATCATQEVSPVTHAVFTSHLEARARCLRLILDSRIASLEQASRLNKLRMTMERWCDALLGQLAAHDSSFIQRYAFDVSRTDAFAEDARQLPAGTARDTAGWLTSAAMRDALMRRGNPNPAFPDANRAVADAVLLSLRPDMFDAVGRCKSLFLHRLERGSEQADRVLRCLAESDITTYSILGGFEAIRSAEFGRW